MSVREVLDWDDLCRNIQPKWEWHHPMGSRLNENERPARHKLSSSSAS